MMVHNVFVKLTECFHCFVNFHVGIRNVRINMRKSDILNSIVLERKGMMRCLCGQWSQLRNKNGSKVLHKNRAFQNYWLSLLCCLSSKKMGWLLWISNQHFIQSGNHILTAKCQPIPMEQHCRSMVRKSPQNVLCLLFRKI